MVKIAFFTFFNASLSFYSLKDVTKTTTLSKCRPYVKKEKVT